MADTPQLPRVDIQPDAVIRALQTRHAQQQAEADLLIASLSAAHDTLQAENAELRKQLGVSANRATRRAKPRS